jgi:uncharacterized protein (DUF433 family)
MTSTPTILRGVVHGKTIELEQGTGLPDGQAVTVAIERIDAAPPPAAPDELPGVEAWVDRLVFDSSVLSGQRIVRGTRLAAEALVGELEMGRSDQELLRAHPELTGEDVAALRRYARLPVGLRRSFGAWAEDADELDRFLDWNRQRRKRSRPEIDA